MKRVLPLLLLVAVLLAACGGQSTATKWASTSTKAPTTAKAAATATAVQPTAAPTPTVTPLPNGCQTVSLLPPPDPAFPDVTKTDWVKGPASAKITILEFSDFQ